MEKNPRGSSFVECVQCKEKFSSLRRKKYCSQECRRKAYEATEAAVARRWRYRLKQNPTRRRSNDRAARQAEGSRRVKLRTEYSRMFRTATERKQRKQREIRAQRKEGTITPERAAEEFAAMQQEFHESLSQLSQHPYWIEFVSPKKSL